MSDDTFDLDLTSFVPNRGSYLPPDTYQLVVEDLDMFTSAAGNPSWKVLSSVVGGEHDGEVVSDFLALTPKALWRVVAFLSALGIPTPKKRLEIPKAMMVGRRFVVSIEDDTYKGAVQSKITSYSPVAPARRDLDEMDEPEWDEPAVSDLVEKVAEANEPVDEPEPATPVQTNARRQPSVTDEVDM